MGIVVVNVGSSTLKLSIFKDPYRYAKPAFKLLLETDLKEFCLDQKRSFKADAELALREALERHAIRAVGHRVVHGGELFKRSAWINPSMLKKLKALTPLAPLHNPLNLWGIEQTIRLLPDIPQVAVFDTAFHQTIPKENFIYAIPRKWLKKGVRRYGFHGISCESCITQLVEQGYDFEKVVVCHLGSGCSVTAIYKNKSIDTTMGMTPLEGVVMGSRSGSIDPGVLLHFLQNDWLTVEELCRMLNYESGLRALAGTNDMRKILSSKTAKATLAIQIFCQSIMKAILAMTSSLNGLDALIFTGGIGENSAQIRKIICQSLPFGLAKLSSKNSSSNKVHGLISEPKSPVKIFVFNSNEELLIAKNVIDMLE